MSFFIYHYSKNRDFNSVYEMISNSKINSLIYNTPAHLNKASVENWLDRMLSSTYYDFLVFYYGNALVGFVYSYNFNEFDGHCRFSIAIKDKFQKYGIGAAGAIFFVDYLFKNYPLRKIYCHVYSLNKPSVDALKSFGATLEGELKDYHFCNGAFQNLLVFSVDKEYFYRRINESSLFRIFQYLSINN